jgi:hypothetical protein
MDRLEIEGEGRKFLEKGKEALVETGENITHNYTRHRFYSDVVERRAREWAKGKNIDWKRLTQAQAEDLLRFVEQDRFVSGFNHAVKDGPEGVKRWFAEEGFQKLPKEMRERAMRYAGTAFTGKTGSKVVKALKVVGKEAGGFTLDAGVIGYTLVKMRQEGASRDQMNRAVMNELAIGIPGMAEEQYDQVVDAMVEHAMNTSFWYVDEQALDKRLDKAANTAPAPGVDMWSNSGRPTLDPPKSEVPTAGSWR